MKWNCAIICQRFELWWKFTTDVQYSSSCIQDVLHWERKGRLRRIPLETEDTSPMQVFFFLYVLSNKGHLFNFVPTIWIAVADKAKMCALYGHIFSSLKKMSPHCLNVIVTYLVIKKIFFLDNID